MNRFEFFKRALKEGERWRSVDWIVSVFCMTQPKEGSQPQAWDVVGLPTGYKSYDSEGKEFMIEGAAAGAPLLHISDELDVLPQDIPNVSEPTWSTCGLLLLNWIELAGIFKDRIPYVNGRFSVGVIEKYLIKNLVDDPQEGETLPEGAVSCSEYLRWTQHHFDLSSISQVVQVGASEKTITSPDGLDEFVQGLLKANEGRLHDPAIIASIQAQVLAYDRKWREGDEGNDFLIGKKAEQIVRMKRNLFYGGEKGADGNGTRMQIISKPLNQGWDPKAFTAMQDTSRMGSFSRGAETMFGGVEVKWLIRATSNVAMAENNCDTQMGVIEKVDAEWVKKRVGYTIIDQGNEVVITEENAGSYLGKVVTRRSPQFCRLKMTDWCATCLGPHLSRAPKELSQAIVAVGSTIMLTSMGAMHGKVLETAKYDPVLEIF